MAVQSVPKVTQAEALEVLIYVSGYSMSEVARAIGMSSSGLRNAVCGRFDLSEDATKRACWFLHVLPERVLSLAKRREDNSQ